MPNVATILKLEISRVARKEIKSEVNALKSASNRYRSDIAALKRQVASLERELKRKPRVNDRAEASASEDAADVSHRFSAKGLASHSPRAKHLPAIAALRNLGKKQAHKVLANR